MPFSAELSLYPLANNYIEVIQAFIDRLNQHEDLTVLTNTMSTQVFGELEVVMSALTEELTWLYDRVPSQVLVCKFINKDLTPDHVK
tara:strand:+ start:2068 stop:2328 length:261 start_codon:yes stop_codon:yes gene_type:complete